MFKSPVQETVTAVTTPVSAPAPTPPLPSPGDPDKTNITTMIIRQDPFNITLDAPAMLAVTLVMVTGMHFMQPHVFSCLLVTLPVLLLVRNDYHNFLKLGPGGTPSTPAGYARLSWYRLFAIRDPLAAPPRHPAQVPSSGILPDQSLPYRPGPRPSVAGLAPQRQLDQWASSLSCDVLQASIERLAARLPQKLGTATSSVEKHGFALFARHPVNVCGNGEVVHVHTNSDGSMHMNLHPDDIKEVIQRGWGERHPLSFGLKAWVRSPVPETFVLIYAPRDENDLHIVVKIIEAAIWYTAAEKVDLQLNPDTRTCSFGPRLPFEY